MYLGALELDVLLGDVRSLAEKQTTVEPVLSELHRFGVSAAEVNSAVSGGPFSESPQRDPMSMVCTTNWTNANGMSPSATIWNCWQ